MRSSFCTAAGSTAGVWACAGGGADSVNTPRASAAAALHCFHVMFSLLFANRQALDCFGGFVLRVTARLALWQASSPCATTMRSGLGL